MSNSNNFCCCRFDNLWLCECIHYPYKRTYIWVCVINYMHVLWLGVINIKTFQKLQIATKQNKTLWNWDIPDFMRIFLNTFIWNIIRTHIYVCIYARIHILICVAYTTIIGNLYDHVLNVENDMMVSQLYYWVSICQSHTHPHIYSVSLSNYVQMYEEKNFSWLTK